MSEMTKVTNRELADSAVRTYTGDNCITCAFSSIAPGMLLCLVDNSYTDYDWHCSAFRPLESGLVIIYD